MQSIPRIVATVPQVASSAAGVAGALARPRVSSHAATETTKNAASSTTIDSTTVTANDFLTLLVAEMKNQDPTKPTDPTAYISQMVGVNSLQQLIGINKGITTLNTATGATGSASSNAVSSTGSSQ
jgi:flagellar basal-body rod modification protein FlgD